MPHHLMLTGDSNLLGVIEPAMPFAHVRERLHVAAVVFAKLACCFYETDVERSPEDEGFYKPPQPSQDPRARKPLRRQSRRF